MTEPINKDDALKFCDLAVMHGLVSIKRVRQHEIVGPVPNRDIRLLIARYLAEMAKVLLSDA